MNWKKFLCHHLFVINAEILLLESLILILESSFVTPSLNRRGKERMKKSENKENGEIRNSADALKSGTGKQLTISLAT